MATVTSLGFNITAKWDGAGLRTAQAQLDSLKKTLSSIDGQSLRITADVDDSAAVQKLNALRAMVTNQSVTVTVNADTADAMAKLAALNAELSKIAATHVTATATVNVNEGGLTAIQARLAQFGATHETATADVNAQAGQLDSIRSRVVQFGTIHSTATADVNANSGALDAIQARLAQFGATHATATASVNTDSGALDLLQARLTAFGAMRYVAHADVDTDSAHVHLTNMNNDVNSSIRFLGGLFGAAGGAGQAIGGMGSAAGGAGSSIGGMGSAASGASSSFGGMAGSIGMVALALTGLVALAPIVAASVALIPVAFVGAAAMLIATNKQLQASFTNAFSNIAKTILPLAMPAINALQKGLQQVNSWLKLIAPAIKEAFAAAAPLIQPMLNIIEKLVGAALPGFTSAMRAMGPLFEGLGQGALKLGGYLGQAADVLARIPGLGQAMNGIMGAMGQVILAAAQAIAAVVSVDHGQALIQLLQALAVLIKAAVPLFQLWALTVTGLAIILRGLGDVLIALEVAWRAFMQFLQGSGPIWTALGIAWNAFVNGMKTTWTVVSAALVVAWNAVWNGMSIAARAIWTGLQIAWQAFINAMVLVWNVVSAALVIAWNAVWNGMSIAVRAIWTGLQIAWTAFVNALILAWQVTSLALSIAWNAVWNAMSIAARAIWTALQIAWTAFVNALALVWTTVSTALVIAWNAVWNGMSIAARAIWTGLQVAWSAFVTAMSVIWTTVSGALVIAWNAVWNGMSTAARAIWTGMQVAWQAFVSALATIWAATSGALTAAWNAAWNGMATAAKAIWDGLVAAWNAFRSAIEGAMTAFRNNMVAAWDLLWNTFKNVASAAWSALQAAWNAFRNVVEASMTAFRNNMVAAWNLLWNTFKNLANAAWSALKTAWNAFRSAIESAMTAFRNNMVAAWNLLWNTFKNVGNAAWSALKTGWNAFRSAIESVMTSFRNNMTAAWNLLWNTLKSSAKSMWDQITNVIKTAIKAIAGAVNFLITGFNRITSALGMKLSLPTISVNFALGGVVGDIPHFSVGGTLNLTHGGAIGGYSPGNDTVPAMLSPGEGVLTPEAVRGLGGAGFVHSANREWAGHRGAGAGARPFKHYAKMWGGREEGFAKGGMVGVPHFAGGGYVDAATQAALAKAHVPLSLISQGSHSNGSLSGGTHLGGGVVDISSTSPAIVAALRAAGFAAWARGPAEGFSPHIHAVLMSAKDLSPQARSQVTSFLHGGNGLANGGKDTGGGLGDLFGPIMDHAGEILKAIAAGSSLMDAVTHFAGDALGGVLSMFGIGSGEKKKKKKGLFGSGIGPDVGPDVLPDVGDAVNNVASDIAGDAAGFMGDMVKGALMTAMTVPVVTTGLSDSKDKLGKLGLPAGFMTDVVSTMGKKGFDGAVSWLVSKAAELAPGLSAFMGGGGDVSKWSGMAAVAMAMGGLNPNQLGKFLALMSHESGGNPMAVNRTDINAKAGHPSMGLMQVIGPTFAAYHVAGTSSNILDPMANMAAAAAYIKARYGGNVPGSPYASGTPSATPGVHLVGENGPEMVMFGGGETVKNAQDTADMLSAGSSTPAPASGGPAGLEIPQDKVASNLALWKTYMQQIRTTSDQTWNGVKATADSDWSSMLSSAGPFASGLAKTFTDAGSNIVGAAKATWSTTRSLASGAWSEEKALGTAFTAELQKSFFDSGNNIITKWKNDWSDNEAVTTKTWADQKAGVQQFSTDMQKSYTDMGTAVGTSWKNTLTAATTETTKYWTDTKTQYTQGTADMQTGFIAPVTTMMTTDLPNAFNASVTAISTGWENLKTAVREPVAAVVDVVFNQGIVAMWNAIAGTFDAPTLDTFTMPAYATGGQVSGAGTGTSDSITARLSHGEHVWTAAEVKGAGGHGNVAALRSAAMGGRPVKGTGRGAFATGGAVGTTGTVGAPQGGTSAATTAAVPTGAEAISAAAAASLGSIGAISNPFIEAAAAAGKEAITALMPNETPFKTMLNNMVDQMAGTVTSWITANDVAPVFSGGANVAAAQQWADAQVGKPYALGGNFGATFDCSQYMSGIARVILGQTPAPWFTTFAFNGSTAPEGFQEGLEAPFMIGITNAGVGHTAGTLNGTNYEATPPAVRSGPSARGYNDPMFTNVYGFAPSIAASGGAVTDSNHLAIIDAALAAAGVPPPGTLAAWESGLNTLITRESNWDPNAINNYDSNAAAGTPSQGLAQVIPPTFAAYHVAGTSNNILDPIANVAAAIRYIVSVYGDISNVQQANPNLPPAGYRWGTRGAQRGWHVVGERGAEWVNFRGGEEVLTNGQLPPASGGNGDISISCPITVHGNMDSDAYQRVENELVPKLRMMLQQRRGK